MPQEGGEDVRTVWSFEASAANARVLAASVQALAAVAREVTFTANEAASEESGPSLTLSALPEGQASFGQVRFEGEFFAKSRISPSRDEHTRFGCKVVARVLLPALRRATAKGLSQKGVSAAYKVTIRHEAPPSTRRRRDSESDDDDPARNDAIGPRLTLEIGHEDGVRRRWRLTYEKADADFVPEFDDDMCGELAAAPTQLLGVFDHVGLANVDLAISHFDGLTVSASQDGDASSFDLTGARTQLKIQKRDLEALELPPPDPDDDRLDDGPTRLDLSVHAKEVHAFVRFCELASVSILRLRFLQPGRPIALDAATPSGAVAQFLVSTSQVSCVPPPASGAQPGGPSHGNHASSSSAGFAPSSSSGTTTQVRNFFQPSSSSVASS